MRISSVSTNFPKNSPYLKYSSYHTIDSATVPSSYSFTIPSNVEDSDILFFVWNNGYSSFQLGSNAINNLGALPEGYLEGTYTVASGATYNMGMSAFFLLANASAANKTFTVNLPYDATYCMAHFKNPNKTTSFQEANTMWKGSSRNYKVSSTNVVTSISNSSTSTNLHPNSTRVTFSGAWGQTGNQGSLSYSGSGSFTQASDSYWWTTLGMAIKEKIGLLPTQETFSVGSGSSMGLISFTIL